MGFGTWTWGDTSNVKEGVDEANIKISDVTGWKAGDTY